MDTSLQGLLLLALILVPGFTHYTIAKSSRTWRTDDHFEIEVILTSLSLTAVILSVESFILGVAAANIDGVRRPLGEALSGGISYGGDHPSHLLIGLPVIFVVNTAIMTGLAVTDPLGNLQERLLRRKKATHDGAWLRAFRPDAVAGFRSVRRTPDDPTWVEVRMKDGTSPQRYRGSVAAFDIVPDGDGTDRYLQLWNPKRWDGEHWVASRMNDDALSSVLLNSRDIVSIELTYYRVPRTIQFPSDR